MGRVFLLLAAVAGATGVALGAFGAHALRDKLAPESLDVWQTAVQYQLWHALALFGIGILLALYPASRWVAAAGWACAAGILVFSGSLYLLALTGARGLGAVTPLGGLALIAGWVLLVVGALRLPWPPG